MIITTTPPEGDRTTFQEISQSRELNYAFWTGQARFHLVLYRSALNAKSISSRRSAAGYKSAFRRDLAARRTALYLET